MHRFMKTLAVIMLMLMTVLLAVGCANPEVSEKEGNAGDNNTVGTYNGHEYVDLGLPSGTLWATCNVGATKPEQFGDCFAWGETKPKTNYDMNIYNYYYSGDPDQLTKYCSNFAFGYHGFTDNLTILLPEDDAATANWGNGWCMPTKEQWEELHDYTSHTWKTWDGVEGRLFKSKNGATLFLPVDGTHGFYWSSELFMDNPSGAWVVIIYNVDEDGSGISGDNRHRYNDYSVRSVRSSR